MKRVLLLLLITITPSIAFSQTSEQIIEKFFNERYALEDTLFAFLEKKDFKRAQETGLKLVELFNALPEKERNENQSVLGSIYYNLACAYSLNGQAKKATEMLEKSFDHNGTDYYYAIKDPDFDNIRNDKNYIALINKVKETNDYGYILKRDHGYRAENSGGYPGFTYEASDSRSMKGVREYFNLDSIAGTGDEISRILNLLSWVHNTIPHNGGNRPYCEMDAIDIYNYSQASGKGVNCRFLAIVLNECYLSMGFKSRFVTCMPKNKDDGDCHVINCVYSETLDKWVWADPSFNAYLKDENGVMLSIEEVRDRIVNGQPVVLNSDANWNNRIEYTKEMYIDRYMSKNLYWLNCAVESGFNVESDYRSTGTKYVALVPAGFDIGKSDEKWTITSDPAYFWQKPE